LHDAYPPARYSIKTAQPYTKFKSYLNIAAALPRGIEFSQCGRFYRFAPYFGFGGQVLCGKLRAFPNHP
jgi:hypothetical protein